MATSRLQQALAGKAQVWGGWVTGATFLAPEEFARVGYDYVGFDTQHGYLDDAGVADQLRRFEHVPIATVVRLVSAAPAPIGRVLDAGADAIIVPMVESADQAADAVAATRYPPSGIRSFGPLRASLGFDVDALQSRVSVFAMVETVGGLDGLDDICAVPGLTGIYVGPADLSISMGHGPAGATNSAEVAAAIDRVQRTAAAAGLVAAVHAGDGQTGNAMARRGFQMITLTTEAKALRRGAADHLTEAKAGDSAAEHPT